MGKGLGRIQEDFKEVRSILEPTCDKFQSKLIKGPGLQPYQTHFKCVSTALFSYGYDGMAQAGSLDSSTLEKPDSVFRFSDIPTVDGPMRQMMQGPESTEVNQARPQPSRNMYVVET